jgi:hypothetical protein
MFQKIRPQASTQWTVIGRSVTAPPSGVARQYSSTTFVSLRFHSRKDKFGARFNSFYFDILKSASLKLRKWGSVCT